MKCASPDPSSARAAKKNAARVPTRLPAAWLVLILTAAWLWGCSPAASLPAASPPPKTVTATSSPTNTSLPSPSDTPLAPTPTSGLPEPTAAPTVILPATPPGPVYGPDNFPAGVNPLTGLQIQDAGLLERRPVVIKVTNFPRTVRPQWGLSLADHVFEYYIADEMSRFIGVFYGNDASRVGPVRSARLFDARVMRMYNGIFVFGWADDPILEVLLQPELKNLLVVERPGNCPPLCRIGPEYAYNTLYADTAQIGPYLAGRRTTNERQNLDGLRFTGNPPLSGTPGETLTIAYSLISYHRWEYDPTSGRYLRYQDAKDLMPGEAKQYAPLTDSLTGVQLAADNILVLLVPHTYFLKSTSTEIFDQPLDGGGQGYAFRDGLIYPITWEQSAENKLLTFTLPNGLTYPLKPGITWFEVVGTTSGFTQPAPAAWDFTFQVP